MNPKILSPAQKKWALTGLLMGVLGFNLSAPLRDSYGTTDLASTAGSRREAIRAAAAGAQVTSPDKDPNVKKDDDKKPVTFEFVKDDGDTVKIKIEKIGDDRVRATPVQGGLNCDLENGQCEAGRVLAVPGDGTEKQIEAALRKVLARERKGVEVADLPRKHDNVEKEQTDEPEKPEWSRKLMRVLSICDRGSRRHHDEEEKSSEEKGRCYVKEYLAALQDKSISKDEAAAFFRSEMRPVLADVITGTSINLAQFGVNVLHSEDGVRGSELLRRLQGSLPSRYTEVRQEVANLSAEVVRKYVQEVKTEKMNAQNMANQAKVAEQAANQAQQQANQLQDPSARMQKMNESNMYRQQALQLRSNAQQMDYQAQTSLSGVQNFISPSLYNQELFGLQDASTSGLVTQNFMQKILNDLQTSTTSVLSDTSLTSITTDLSLNTASNTIGPQFTTVNGKQVLQVPQFNNQGTIGPNRAGVNGQQPVPFGSSGGGTIQRQYNPNMRTF